MAWKTLTKEQKQHFILGVLIVGTLLYAVKVLFLDGVISRQQMAEAPAEEARMKLSDYHNRLLPSSNKLAREAQGIRAEMLEITDSQLPPKSGEFAWAANQVYQLQQALGVEITKEDLGVLTTGSAGGFFLKESMFIPYMMKAGFRGSFAEIAETLYQFEARYPHATISRMNITPTTNPEIQNVDLILQWPTWANEARLTALRDSSPPAPALPK